MRGVAAAVRIATARLASFSVILLCLITLFAGSGMLAFGQQMAEFHTFQDSIVSTLVVITTGEADIYNRQYLISPAVASIWHWLLICVMWVVCLNLILCILVDAYSEAQTTASDSEEVTPSLIEQAKETGLFYLAQSFQPTLERILAASKATEHSEPQCKQGEETRTEEFHVATTRPGMAPESQVECGGSP